MSNMFDSGFWIYSSLRAEPRGVRRAREGGIGRGDLHKLFISTLGCQVCSIFASSLVLYRLFISTLSDKLRNSEGGYGWKPSSSSNCSIRAFRAYPLIEIRPTVPCRAIRGNSISVKSNLPPLKEPGEIQRGVQRGQFSKAQSVR